MKLLISLRQALQNIGAHLLHTLLSVLGIVIGVAALVTILSLIDGMERFANDQISTTTSLQDVLVQSRTHQTVNGVRVRRDSFPLLTYERFQTLQRSLSQRTEDMLSTNKAQLLTLSNTATPVGVWVMASTAPLLGATAPVAGRGLTADDVDQRRPVAYINTALARRLVPDGPLEAALNQKLSLTWGKVTVIGITDREKNDTTPRAAIPLTLLPEATLRENPPGAVFRAQSVEEVPRVEAELEKQLSQMFPAQTDQVEVVTNAFRVEQSARAFLLFRLIMGFIVGISVVVGGIGVMNVLLISVTERTVEIGLRKALGADRRDITLQFLAESVTISALGSTLGLLLGVLMTLLAIPIIKAIVDVDFEATFTANTLLIVAAIAVLVGVIFGTYPAMRAARLDPVEAIRKE